MKKFTTLFTLLAILLAFSLNAQVAINNDGSNANTNAVLHVKSGTTTPPTPFVNSLFIHKTTGNIGIRTLAPACPLQFISPGDNVWLMQWDNNDASNGAAAKYEHANENNGNRVLMGATNYDGSANAAAGVIGISLNTTTSGSGGIGVSGNANNHDGTAVEGYLYISNPSYTGWAGYFNADVYGAAFYDASDEKLKRDIQPIDNALAVITNIEPVSYYYDTEKYPGIGFDQDRLSYGFVAQELESILPTLVKNKTLVLNNTGRKTTDLFEKREVETFKVVNYTLMIPILTQAIKEQQEIIETLEKRLTAIESKVNNQ